MWESLIKKAKDGGLDVIDTYVFWNLHEPSPGNVCIYFFVFYLLVLECFTFFVLIFSLLTLYAIEV